MADFNETVNQFINTEDTTGQFDPSDIEKNKGMAILAYIGILVLVPILAAKESKYARYHANQGLVLWIASIAIGVVCGVISILPVIGFVGGLLSALGSLACFVLMILGIVNAAKGQCKQLPVIGGIVILK